MNFTHIILFYLTRVTFRALQFMAYEELKKDNSQYFGTLINKKLILSALVCIVDCIRP